MALRTPGCRDARSGEYRLQVRQRVGVITLGVRDLSAARRVYEALGWRTGADPDDDVVFFQGGDMVVALWDRAKLAHDSCVEDAPGWGGVTLALNLGSYEVVDAVTEEARGRRHDRAGAGRDVLGRLQLGLHRPDGPPCEIAHNPHWTLTAEGGVRLP
jgi:uncharacterized protein